MTRRFFLAYIPSVLALAALLLFPRAASSQTLANLTVSVADSSGGAIQKAKIMLVSPETGLQRQTESDENGIGRIINVPSGDYELRVEFTGFKPAVRSVHLAVGQSASLALTLSIETAAMTTTVTETEEAQIQPTKSQVSEVISERQIVDLPIKGRNFIDFVMLTRRSRWGTAPRLEARLRSPSRPPS